MFPSPIKKPVAGIFLILTAALFFFGCQKELSNENPGGSTGQPADLVTKVTISIASGFVTDENNLPVKNAAVTLGTANTTTDKFGYFEFRNTEVVKNAAFVTVTQPGYFKGIKTFLATAGKGFFTRIKLIPKIIKGNINAATGGNVTLTNGLIIALPANSVVNAATGAVYSGSVSVAAFHINPEATDLNQIMPGDLRGINTAGSLKLLQTYGMAAVELTGASGELLQIAPGKKATLTMPVPGSLSSTAPASIPLWYFDETKGLWKEEGSAVKTGNTYVGEVAHFSFWNCDVPNNYVWLDATFVGPNGQPLSFTKIKITEINSQGNSRYGYTDAAGYISGQVPDNAQLLLEVYGSGINQCNTPAYTQTISSNNVNISLGTITVNNSSAQANITGTVLNCSNSPVTKGSVILNLNNENYIYPTDASGLFSFNLVLCSGAATALLTPIDSISQQQGIATPFTINAGNNLFGNLIACGTSTVEFINYTVNSNTVNMTTPADLLTQQPDSNSINAIRLFGYSNAQSTVVFISFSKTNIAAGSVQSLVDFQSTQSGYPSVITTIPANIPVNITEYGNVGQYIAGNFSGNIQGPAPANIVYPVNCSFRVRRSY